ncbi:MAG: hypothetical protein Q8N51_00775 [Gammaproteobacteria bacterium]|nr:hypothetical protein [Gammaproteobacteria bacterium]
MELAEENRSPPVPTVDEIVLAMPNGGLTIRDMRALWPVVGQQIGVMMQTARIAGLVELCPLSGRWKRKGKTMDAKTIQRRAAAVAVTPETSELSPVPTIPQKAEGQQASKLCAHPGCLTLFHPKRINARYCAEHGSKYWDNQRRNHPEKFGLARPIGATQSPEPRNSRTENADLELPARRGIKATTDQAGNSLVVRIEYTDFDGQGISGAIEMVGGQVGAFHEWLTEVMRNARQSGDG